MPGDTDTVARLFAASTRWTARYLDTLAVAPASQGRGLGGALLRRGLERAGDLPVFLHTVKPENVPYYSRFGFDVVDTARLVEDGPPAWTMRRG
jgi:predicted N-acetyltransferase YhbS